MRTAKLDDMTRGWLIGNFEPTLYRTNEVEVAVKRYSKGDSEGSHFHKIATEFTVILDGSVRMFHQVWRSGDIVIVEPGDCTDFSALSDCITVVVKIPGASHDKYDTL